MLDFGDSPWFQTRMRQLSAAKLLNHQVPHCYQDTQQERKLPLCSPFADRGKHSAWDFLLLSFVQIFQSFHSFREMKCNGVCQEYQGYLLYRRLPLQAS